MKTAFHHALVAATFALVASSADRLSAAAIDAQPLGVVVGIPPVGQLVERIGGEHVAVSVLSPGGQCAHDLAISPRQAVELGKARLFLTINMPFEVELQSRLVKTHAQLKCVDVSAKIQRRSLGGAAGAAGHSPSPDDHAGHDHDAHADHAASGDDPHVWLSPALLGKLADGVARALIEADPPHAETFRANLAALQRQIDTVAAKTDKVLRPLKGKTVYVYHPSLGYLLDEYGIRQVAVESGGKAPSARELRELIKRARADGVKAVFVEEQADQRAARSVAEAVGATLVPFDPLAKDAVANLEKLSAKIAGQDAAR